MSISKNVNDLMSGNGKGVVKETTTVTDQPGLVVINPDGSPIGTGSGSVRGGTPTQTAVVVGTGSTSVASASSTRQFLQLINDSDETIYVSLNGAAALNTGVRLNANGGTATYDEYIPRGAITAISTTGTKKLLVISA